MGDFDGIVNVVKGQELSFAYQADYLVTGRLPTQYDLSKKVKRGERIYLYDGKVRTVVTSVHDGVVHIRAENDGILIKRKGMNLPDTDFSGDILTPKDKADLVFGSAQDFDYVGSAPALTDTFAAVQKTQPDIVLLDHSAGLKAVFEFIADVKKLLS